MKLKGSGSSLRESNSFKSIDPFMGKNSGDFYFYNKTGNIFSLCNGQHQRTNREKQQSSNKVLEKSRIAF